MCAYPTYTAGSLTAGRCECGHIAVVHKTRNTHLYTQISIIKAVRGLAAVTVTVKPKYCLYCSTQTRALIERFRIRAAESSLFIQHLVSGAHYLCQLAAVNTLRTGVIFGVYTVRIKLVGPEWIHHFSMLWFWLEQLSRSTVRIWDVLQLCRDQQEVASANGSFFSVFPRML